MYAQFKYLSLTIKRRSFPKQGSTDDVYHVYHLSMAY